MGWYVRTQPGKQAQGPFSFDKIGEYIDSGRVRADMWFSRDGETWAQQPAELFPELNAPRSAGRGRRRADSVPEPEFEAPPPKRSSAPWLAAGVTVVLLVFALAVDKWATTTMSLSLGKTISTSFHFGRADLSTSVDVPGRDSALRVQSKSYVELREGARDLVKPMFSKTILYGHLLLWLTLLACAVRLTGAYLTWKAARFAGSAASVYLLATTAVAAVFVVALLFNDGGVLGPMSSSFSSLGLLGEGGASTGFGASAWLALFALVVDGFGILSTKAALTPRRAPARRRSRRIR